MGKKKPYDTWESEQWTYHVTNLIIISRAPDPKSCSSKSIVYTWIQRRILTQAGLGAHWTVHPYSRDYVNCMQLGNWMRLDTMQLRISNLQLPYLPWTLVTSGLLGSPFIGILMTAPAPPRAKRAARLRQVTRGAWDLCGARGPLESARVWAACEARGPRSFAHLVSRVMGVPPKSSFFIGFSIEKKPPAIGIPPF